MMTRPTGVTVLAVLAAIWGVLGLLGGVALVFGGGLAGAYGSVPVGGLARIFGLVTLVVSIGELYFAYGAWTLKPWGWRLGIYLQIAAIVIAILAVVLLGTSIANVVVGVVVSLVILYYLNNPAVRSAFGAPATGWPMMGA